MAISFDKASKPAEMDENQVLRGVFYQPVVFYREEIKAFLKKVPITTPIYSNSIFTTPNEATIGAGIFLKQLVADNTLPKEVIKDDAANEDLIKLGFVKLEVGMVEFENERN